MAYTGAPQSRPIIIGTARGPWDGLCRAGFPTCLGLQEARAPQELAGGDSGPSRVYRTGTSANVYQGSCIG